MENIKNNTADKVSIKPQMLKGTVSVPASKSALHRGIIAAALSGGKCTIKNVSMSQDIEATLRRSDANRLTIQRRGLLHFHPKEPQNHRIMSPRLTVAKAVRH